MTLYAVRGDDTPFVVGLYDARDAEDALNQFVAACEAHPLFGDAARTAQMAWTTGSGTDDDVYLTMGDYRYTARPAP